MGPKSIVVDVNYEDGNHCQLLSVVPQILQGSQIVEWKTKNTKSIGFLSSLHILQLENIFSLVFYAFGLSLKNINSLRTKISGSTLYDEHLAKCLVYMGDQ